MKLKNLFPAAYNKSPVGALVTYIIIAIIAGALMWAAGFVTGWIPVVGAVVNWVLRIIATVVSVYVIAGIIVTILVALDVID